MKLFKILMVHMLMINCTGLKHFQSLSLSLSLKPFLTVVKYTT